MLPCVQSVNPPVLQLADSGCLTGSFIFQKLDPGSTYIARGIGPRLLYDACRLLLHRLGTAHPPEMLRCWPRKIVTQCGCKAKVQQHNVCPDKLYRCVWLFSAHVGLQPRFLSCTKPHLVYYSSNGSVEPRLLVSDHEGRTFLPSARLFDPKHLNYDATSTVFPQKIVHR